MPYARISAVEYFLPERKLTNRELAEQFPEWTAEKITAKTGITERSIAADGETAADLAVQAGKKLIGTGAVTPEEIDFVLLCTQGPDYFLPASACVIQDRLGIPTTAGAVDINQGCSGYIYSLMLANGLIATGAATTVLVLTADTYSKYIAADDKSVKTLFGDGAAATLIRAVDQPGPDGVGWIGPFHLGTDGAGADKLIVPTGAMRTPAAPDTPPTLTMDGPSIFSFTLKTVPKTINALLEKAGIAFEEIDRFVFHQANLFMIETLRRQMKIPADKFVIDMADKGNTVSSTIPIALTGVLNQREDGAPPERILLIGFGVGLSWGATLVTV